MKSITNKLHENPFIEVNGHKVIAVDDFYKLESTDGKSVSKIDLPQSDVVKLYFDDKVRKFFIQKAEPKTVYEGNSEYFIISTSEITKFEDMIKFFEKSLKFYVELTSL